MLGLQVGDSVILFIHSHTFHTVAYRRGSTLGRGNCPLPSCPHQKNLGLAPKYFGYSSYASAYRCKKKRSVVFKIPYAKMRFRPGLGSGPRRGSSGRSIRSPSRLVGEETPLPCATPLGASFLPLSVFATQRRRFGEHSPQIFSSRTAPACVRPKLDSIH